MKRVKSACILQTLMFTQKPEMGYSKEKALKINHEEIEHYKAQLEKAKKKYIIIDETEQPDGSVIIHVKKQYSADADCSEYFE